MALSIELSTLQKEVIRIQADAIVAVIDAPGGGSKIKIKGNKSPVRVRESLETVQELIRKTFPK